MKITRMVEAVLQAESSDIITTASCESVRAHDQTDFIPLRLKWRNGHVRAVPADGRWVVVTAVLDFKKVILATCMAFKPEVSHIDLVGKRIQKVFNANEDKDKGEYFGPLCLQMNFIS